MKLLMNLGRYAMLGICCLAGCVSQVYQPGSADNPFNRLKLGQGYGDMVRELGKPDRSCSQDRSGQEAAVLLVPGWNLVESAGDINPSSTQVYSYDRWGTITIGNNRILRIEAKESAGNGNH
jgi:hypothetical protein